MIDYIRKASPELVFTIFATIVGILIAVLTGILFIHSFRCIFIVPFIIGVITTILGLYKLLTKEMENPTKY